ncbi:MAG TPA: hypothetical protein V6C85_23605 [Allocoleopsis sp.]
MDKVFKTQWGEVIFTFVESAINHVTGAEYTDYAVTFITPTGIVRHPSGACLSGLDTLPTQADADRLAYQFLTEEGRKEFRENIERQKKLVRMAILENLFNKS